jgi:hypothetical protein
MRQDEASRVRQGASTTTTPDIMWALATDPSVTVRASLALNPALPAEIGALLAVDADARVRMILNRKLAPLTPALTDEARRRVQQDAVASLTAMVADAALRVRANIAEAVREMPDGPREIVLRLAHDPAVMVCEPVIRFSPMLTQEDLVALITSGPPPTTILAVANRPRIGPAVSDAIVGTADNVAIGALLANRTAHIREVTLDALAAQSEEQTGWQEPLVNRPHLPPMAQRMLSEIVTGHLLETLAARGDLDPKVSQMLRSALTRLPANATPSGQKPQRYKPEGHKPEGRKPEGQQPGDGSAKGAVWAAELRSVAHPDQAEEPLPRKPSGLPDDRAIMEALRRNDLADAGAMLAARADVPVAAVERACELRSSKAMASLAWKAGMSPQTAVVLQAMLARLSPETILRPGPEGECVLSADEMRWQLTFLTGHADRAPTNA